MKTAKRTILVAVIAFFVSFSMFFAFHQKRQSTSVSRILKQISLEEQEALDCFLRMVIAGDSFGYVLFGQKPLAVSVFGEPQKKLYWIDDWVDHIPSAFCYNNLKIIRGMKVWKKYQHLLPIKNFAFVLSENFVDNGMGALIFINKKAFLATVKQNLNDFRSVLGKNITPESLLDEILHSNDVFGSVFKNHQGLIGTILGYGRHNAWLFHERDIIWKKINYGKGASPEDFREYSRIDQLLKPFRNGTSADLNPFSLGLPYFVADLEHAETKRLKMEYEKTYRSMMDSYIGRNFLEVTLEKMVQTN